MSELESERRLTLSELKELAGNRSPQTWRALLRGLTDHFVESLDVNAAQSGEAFSDIVCQLLDHVEVDAREELSSRVAPLEMFPHAVVKRLAHDDYSVAGPVLEFSPVLSDTDLIHLTEELLKEHRLAISRRKRIGTRLTDALLETDDMEIVREVAGNNGARFSPTTYRKVAERAKQDTALQGKLVERSDLSQAITILLTPFLADELKEKLQKQKEEVSSGDSLLDSLSSIIQEGGHKAESSEPSLEDIPDLVRSVTDGTLNLSNTVTELADAGRFNAVCVFLSEYAELAEKSVRSAFKNLNGTPLAVICRGLDISEDAFEAIAALRCEETELPHSEVLIQVEAYRLLSPADAKRTLNVLQQKRANEKKASAA